jgi:hypothetical protein
MAITLADSRSVLLPHGIVVDEVLDISREAQVLGREVQEQDNLFEVLPKLHGLIMRLQAQKFLGGTPEEVLTKLKDSLQSFLREQQQDQVQLFNEFLDDYLRLRRLELSGGLGEPEGARTYGEGTAHKDESQYLVNQIVNNFRAIGENFLLARELVPKIKSVRELISSTTVLPAEESDRLLRYQTSWERRLSSAVGEFLELRARGARL